MVMREATAVIQVLPLDPWQHLLLESTIFDPLPLPPSQVQALTGSPIPEQSSAAMLTSKMPTKLPQASLPSSWIDAVLRS